MNQKRTGSTATKVKMTKHSITWMFYIFFCALGGFAGPPALGQGQVAPPSSSQNVIVLPSDQFCSDLEILARRLRIAFVAEGEPVFVNKEVPVPSLDKNLTTDNVVREVADYFDYSAVRKGNVYLLTKRYTNPSDLPDVTSEECRAAIKSIVKILAEYNPKIPSDTRAGTPEAAIITLLTADQLTKLGTDGLPVSDLTPAQHAELWRLARKFYLQNEADQCEQLLDELESRNPADPTFHWQTVANVHAFGYDTRSMMYNKIMFFPVSDSHRLGVSPGGTVLPRTGTRTVGGVVVAIPDPTDPNALPAQVKLFLDDKAKSLHCVTLSDAIAALNGPSGNGVTYKVDPMFTAKHVTLVGTDQLSGDALMQALAAVYGLRVAHNEDGRIVLTRPLVIEATQISELGRALASAIPAPINREIQAGALSSLIRNQPGPPRSHEYQSHGNALCRSAMQRFRYIAEPQVKSQPEAQLTLSKLGDRARSMFEFSQTARAFGLACWMASRPLPPYINDLDHVTLTGGSYHNEDGSDRFSLFFSYINPQTGKMYQGVGFTNARVPQ
ncbi:MAG: hypothetical protein JWL77_2001 [Chthonomonadaceae bacterium]|nr:hypothetical protein [Chthonomonadaceae bacterium]